MIIDVKMDLNLNLNLDSYRILDSIKADRIEYNIGGKKAVVVDLINGNSTIENGVKVAKATMGGLGKVSYDEKKLYVEIEKDVALSTLGCQLAGWKVKIKDKAAFGSGPARILSRKPKEIFEFLEYKEKSKYAALALESEILPDERSCQDMLEKCNSDYLIVAAFKGDSKVGLFNVIARIVEVGIFRLKFLNFDVRKVTRAKGDVFIPEDAANGNDAIIYGGAVEMKVEEWDESLTAKCVSMASKVYGRTYRDISEEVGGDFHKIDPDIFAPAMLKIENKADMKTYSSGMINEKILNKILK